MLDAPSSRSSAGPLTIAGGSVLVGGRFVTADVVVDQGSIAAIGRGLAPRGEVVDCTDRYVIPGLVDVGARAGGMCSFAENVDDESYACIARAHASSGTTAICPTITSAPPDQMLKAVALAADLCERGVEGGAAFVGVHVEGPFLVSDRTPSSAPVQPPSLDFARALVDAGRGWLRLVTLAPELDGALEVVRFLSERGVHVCAGHTSADAGAMYAAMAEGLTGVTRLFEDMDPLDARAPGPVGVALASNLYAGVVADLVHVDRDSLAVVLRARPFGRTHLTTAAVPPLGTSVDEFETGGTTLRVVGDACHSPDGRLLGSVTTLSRMVRNLILDLDMPVDVAVAMASAVPAQLLGLRGRGEIRPGAVADLLVIQRYRVDAIILRGELIERFPNYTRL